MVLYGTINVYGLGYGSQDTTNLIFFKCLDEFFSTQSALYGCFKSFLSIVDFFACSSIWLPSYHKFHIWLGYGCQERFMVVNPGSPLPNCLGELYSSYASFMSISARGMESIIMEKLQKIGSIFEDDFHFFFKIAILTFSRFLYTFRYLK